MKKNMLFLGLAQLFCGLLFALQPPLATFPTTLFCGD